MEVEPSLSVKNQDKYRCAATNLFPFGAHLLENVLSCSTYTVENCDTKGNYYCLFPSSFGEKLLFISSFDEQYMVSTRSRNLVSDKTEAVPFLFLAKPPYHLAGRKHLISVATESSVSGNCCLKLDNTGYPNLHANLDHILVTPFFSFLLISLAVPQWIYN
jgi:hypothetical protein